MRLWSLHPELLDRAALVAGWREGMLAQAVLLGRTKGYTRHPQLERFRSSSDSEVAIATWLEALAAEADARGYRFDRTRIVATPDVRGMSLPVTRGQLDFECEHLRRKVRARAPEWEARLMDVRPHPMFCVVPGPVEPSEKG